MEHVKRISASKKSQERACFQTPTEPLKKLTKESGSTNTAKTDVFLWKKHVAIRAETRENSAGMQSLENANLSWKETRYFQAIFLENIPV